MARLVILHLLAAAAAAASTLDQFEEFKLRFGKVYPSAEEEATRLAIFRTNLEEYARLQAEVSYSVGVTMFSDLTEQEFKERHLGAGGVLRRPRHRLPPRALRPAGHLLLPQPPGVRGGGRLQGLHSTARIQLPTAIRAHPGGELALHLRHHHGNR